MFQRLKAALLSGKKEAYAGMLFVGLGPLARKLDAFLPRPKRRAQEKEDKPPTCFVVMGPPRSGSTAIYQNLVGALGAVYLTNLHSLFPRRASRWLRIFRGWPNCGEITASSYYGYSVGLAGVNECNEVLAEILEPSADKGEMGRRFKDFLADISVGHGAPIIVKNIRYNSRALQIQRMNPNVVIIRIKRNLENNVQSVVRAYHELGGFHPIPDRLVGRLPEIGYLRFAVEQIREIESQLDLQRREADPARWIEWSYEEFCDEPDRLIGELVRNHLREEMPEEIRTSQYDLALSNRQKVTDTELAEIRQIIADTESRESEEQD